MTMMLMDKGGGGVGDDMGEGMQCSDHPYRKNSGGICAFCLQEKLGKLVSSSKSNPSFPGLPSTSSSPSFRSEGDGVGSSSSVSVPPSSSNNNNYDHHHPGRLRIPFLSAQRKPKKMVVASSDAHLVLKRSRSSAAPRGPFFDADEYNLRKRGFWSFLHLSSKRRNDRERDSKPSIHPTTTTTTTISTTRTTAKDKGGQPSSSSRSGDYVDDNESPNSSHTSSSSFGRKVARSRSVGCGSRSFSGDFLERISTGFGDCTLRRVESQREAKPKIVLHHHHHGISADEHHRIKERVKCGGIFGGFSMSSSFSSSYWLSTSAEDMNGRSAPGVPHSRSKSWGWAFASPMRAFSRPPKPDEKDGRRDIVNTSTTTSADNNTPNLAAIPSLLAARG